MGSSLIWLESLLIVLSEILEFFIVGNRKRFWKNCDWKWTTPHFGFTAKGMVKQSLCFSTNLYTENRLASTVSQYSYIMVEKQILHWTSTLEHSRLPSNSSDPPFKDHLTNLVYVDTTMILEQMINYCLFHVSKLNLINLCECKYILHLFQHQSTCYHVMKCYPIISPCDCFLVVGGMCEGVSVEVQERKQGKKSCITSSILFLWITFLYIWNIFSHFFSCLFMLDIL